MTATLQQLLGKIPKSTFVEQYYQRLPFSLPGAARPLCGLGSWHVLGEILPQENVDVMVVADGRQQTDRDPWTLEQARAFSAAGCTILVRHAERHCAELRQLAAAFENDLHAPANIHLYATPPGRHGFSWHYDAEEVFIFQTSGRKEYLLRKNTVHPWPLVETIPRDMAYPREIMPLMRVQLNAGDWLYIPCGYWHRAEACESAEAAISLALGVMSPSALDVFDWLRPQLLESLLWRQRLPVTGSAAAMSQEQLRERYRSLLEQLAADLAKTLHDERFLAEFLARWETRRQE